MARVPFMSKSWLPSFDCEYCSSVGGKPGNRTLEPFTASRFQDGVLVHAARFPKVPGLFPGGQVHARFLPYSNSLGSIEPRNDSASSHRADSLETSLGVEPRTSSFAAKTHAVWLEIIGERDGIRTRTKALSL
jgi:hypothetical protein